MRTLLIVDDEKLIADSLHAMLARAFAGRLETCCCYSSSEALALAAEKKIDILLTDINLPDQSGLALHAELMTTRPEMQVIYLTGYSDFEYARTAVDQHAFAYLLKGEGDEAVISTVEKALGRLPEEREKEKNGETDPEGNRLPEWLEELHSYIGSHLEGDLSLNALADFCHFHPVYLSRVYRETTGMTLSDSISEARLAAAKRLLRETRKTVAEISEETGFATDNYFCRWFRKQTGVSPQHYRTAK